MYWISPALGDEHDDAIIRQASIVRYNPKISVNDNLIAQRNKPT